jgi:hypothetical protein
MWTYGYTRVHIRVFTRLHKRFGGKYRLQRKGRSRWRQCSSPKLRYLPTSAHGPVTYETAGEGRGGGTGTLCSNEAGISEGNKLSFQGRLRQTIS